MPATRKSTRLKATASAPEEHKKTNVPDKNECPNAACEETNKRKGATSEGAVDKKKQKSKDEAVHAEVRLRPPISLIISFGKLFIYIYQRSRFQCVMQ